MNKDSVTEKTELVAQSPSRTNYLYVWVDGQGTLRSSVFNTLNKKPTIQRFDGSATKQASTDNADLFLVPIKTYSDSEDWSFGMGYVLCEVQTADGTPHASNTRADLAKFLLNNTSLASEVSLGFEQDFFLINPTTRQPYMWPTNKDDKGAEQVMFPGPQGRYYAGSGDFVRGRTIVDAFSSMCSTMQMSLLSYNAGICLSQWSFVTKESTLLDACDDLIMRRFLLEKAAEESESNYGATGNRCVISLSPKTFPGLEWNGSGCNFRIYLNNYTNSAGNPSLAKTICETIGDNHREHIAAYGIGNETRLIGKTQGISDYNKFSWGFGDRTASICVPTIPNNIEAANDFMFIEDRRPGANVDPYAGVLALARTLVNVVDLKVEKAIKTDTFSPKLVK